MDEIPSNYNIPFSKLKEYLSGWLTIEERDKYVSKTKRCREIVNKLHPEEIMFSHNYATSENFSEETIVGTKEIKDHCLSMMINQIIGFDIVSGDYNPPEECREPRV